MTRTRTLSLALATLLALVALLPFAHAQEMMLDPRVFDIGRLLRCPTCVAESVSESSAPIAREMRQIIQEQLDEGRTQAEILAFFQDRYGDWILLDPPRTGALLWVWLLPVIVAVGGLVSAVVMMRRWQNAAASISTAGVDPEDLERVRAALRAAETPSNPNAGA